MASEGKRQAVAAPDPAQGGRSLPRRKTFKLVTLHAGDAGNRAHMLNVSTGGACVHCQTPLAVGAPVAVNVGDRRLSGCISWVAGERYGIRFTVPLTATEVDAIAV